MRGPPARPRRRWSPSRCSWLVVATVVHRGAPALSLDFLFTNPAGLAGGGIANALLGTGVIVAFAALIAVPVGVLTGLYLTEFAGRATRAPARVLKLVLDLLQGLPTIIVGVVVYGLIVVAEHKETASPDRSRWRS